MNVGEEGRMKKKGRRGPWRVAGRGDEERQGTAREMGRWLDEVRGGRGNGAMERRATAPVSLKRTGRGAWMRGGNRADFPKDSFSGKGPKRAMPCARSAPGGRKRKARVIKRLRKTRRRERCT